MKTKRKIGWIVLASVFCAVWVAQVLAQEFDVKPQYYSVKNFN